MTLRHPDLLPLEDLEHILHYTRGLWDDLRGQKIFISGGTGFFGRWLLESFIFAHDALKLDSQAFILTRDPDAFAFIAPHLSAHPALHFVRGDVRDFTFPDGSFSHVIHAATEASAKLNEENPLKMLDTIEAGTARMLEMARHCGAKRFLLTSSGAIYGKQPPHLSHISEDFNGAPAFDDRAAAYGEGKRIAELMCAVAQRQTGLETVIARAWAFVGPQLPLDAHFAVGNFLRDGMNGGPIRIQGDGTPLRSYLYAADLAIWLWTMLLRGKSGRAYNLGSSAAVSIAQLARLVAQACPQTPEVSIARVADESVAPSRYVPGVERARDELGLEAFIDLPEALRRTVAWHQKRHAIASDAQKR